MPLSFVHAEKENDVLMLNTEEKNFFQFVDDLEERADRDAEYSIALNIDVKFSKSTSRDAIKMAFSKDRNAIKVTMSEEQIKAKYPLDYRQLTEICKARYTDFLQNNNYHKNRRLYENDSRYAYTRYLDPDNKKSGKKTFYSETILTMFDKHYTKSATV